MTLATISKDTMPENVNIGIEYIPTLFEGHASLKGSIINAG